MPVVARADAPAPAPVKVIAPMQVADDSVCDLLRADKRDSCKRIAKRDHAEVFQSGSKRGIRRVVLAIEHDGEQLVSDGTDYLGEDCSSGSCVKLTAIAPTIHDVQIDGRAGVVVELVATFKQRGASWQTESLIGCGPRANGDAAAWKCETVALERCIATVGDDGGVVTSCGTRTTLSLGPD
jgi:hypothetical protein